MQAHYLVPRAPSASLACSGMVGAPGPQLWPQVLEPWQGRGVAQVPSLLLLLRPHVGPAVVARQWGPFRSWSKQGMMGPASRAGLLEMLPSRSGTLAGWLRYLPAKCKGSHPTRKQARL